jgi:hypothetical protein
MMNSGMFRRIFFQFKSFSFASHSKVLAASLQERDAAVMNSIMTGVFLGMVGYWVNAVVSGGQTYENMLEADLDQWLDEGINRSGILGAFDIANRLLGKSAPVQDLLEEYPMLDTLTPLSARPLSNRGAGGVVGEIAGPTGDLIARTTRIAQAINDPTDTIVSDFRGLLPAQNTFYLDRIFDFIEGGIKEYLPDDRRE